MSVVAGISSDCVPVVPSSYNKDEYPRAYFYEHACNGPQRYIGVRSAGDEVVIQDMGRNHLNDRITTVVIPPNAEAIMYADACITQMRQGGASTGGNCRHKKVLGKGKWDLRAQRYDSGSGMNDNISEVKVNFKKPHKQWLTDCCFGKVTPASDCANFSDPNGADCINLITEHCSQKGNFYTADCRRWVQNLSDARRNDIARQVCSQASSPQEKEWCACFIPRDIPPELEHDQSIRALWPCLDPTCNDATKALQPFQKNCPTTLNICNQTDIVTKLQESDVGNQRITNECGQIKLGEGSGGGGGSSSGGGSSPMAPAAAATETKGSKTPLIVGGVAGGVILILLIVVIVLATRGRGRGRGPR